MADSLGWRMKFGVITPYMPVGDAQVETFFRESGFQVGTNLACAKVAAEGEHWLDKPVLAINTCAYWYALRQNGIQDRMDGFGSLLLEH